MYHAFLINVIVVLFLCCAVIMITLSIHRKYSPYILGVMFGLITIFVIQDKIAVVDGQFFDFRHITMTMAGFIGGPITAVIATIISSLYRYSIGGIGSMGGITNIIVFACFGSILSSRVKSSQNGKKAMFWFIIGIVMDLVLIGIIFPNAPWTGDSAVAFNAVAGPLLIFTPFATTIIFNFYFWADDFLAKTSILNTIINSSPINLMIFDSHGSILISNSLKAHRQPFPYIENPTLLMSPDKKWPSMTIPQHREIATEDGRHLVADLSSFQMPSGKYACVAIINDLTDRKREQDTLKEVKETFSKVFQLGPHMMAIIRKSDHQYIDVNRRFLETKGFTRDEVIGKTPPEMGVPKSEFRGILKALEEKGLVQNMECTLVKKFGAVGTLIISAETIHIDDQECILLAYNDITDLKRMQTERVEQLTKLLTLEADLSQSTQLIADINNNMPNAFYILDDQWRITYINQKAEEFFLRPRKELLGSVLWDIIPHALGTAYQSNFEKVKENRLPITFDYLSVLHKDLWFEVIAYPSQHGLSVYFRDITERKSYREKLIESQKQLNLILESMADCFLAINKDLRLTFINCAGEKVFGKTRDELLGKKMTDIIKLNDISLQKFDEVINQRTSVTYETFSKTFNIWFEISVYPTETGLTCFFRNITSKKISENEIARLDRLNLVGQLAAGIGHEIRNPLTTVRGYLQLLGANPEYATRKSTFDLMISELDRANDIITEFLSLARLKQTELKPQNLNTLLKNIYPLLEADTFTQNKQICLIAGEIPNLELNSKEITQLVLNLTRNGLEAMQESGCLTIKSYVEDDRVVLEINDEGCGVSAENLRKLGTPFFTTKDNGTGLGLATCYKIAEGHNAKIRIDSSSRGTTFYIYFPILNQDKDKQSNEWIA